MPIAYVVVITAADGTLSLVGPFADPAVARQTAERLQEAGLDTQVRPLERPGGLLAAMEAK